MPSIIEKYKTIALVTMPVILAAVILIVWMWHGLAVDISDGATDSFEDLYAVLAILLTALLIGVAYCQLHKIKTTTSSEFLLRVNENFRKTEIIQARKIINEMYRDARKIHLAENCEGIHEYIRNEIKETGKNKDKSENFIYLLSLLELLETISFFIEKGYIEKIDFDELFNNDMMFFYEIYKDWIKARNDKNKNDGKNCFKYFTKIFGSKIESSQ